MTESKHRRRSFFRLFGTAGVGAGIAAVAGTAPASAQVAVAGWPWVGPAGSGAPFVVDPAIGAQKAINDALAAVGQGAVYLAGGVYPVRGPVIIGNQQSLVGAGPLSTILKAVSGFAGDAMVRTPAGSFTGVRMSVRDIGLEAASIAATGIKLEISDKPSSYGPDPAPWLSRVFVSGTTGDGIFLGGAYAGGQREYKITDCRVERAGGWAYHLDSSDGFVGGCSAQGGAAGGYNLAGGNTKAWRLQGIRHRFRQHARPRVPGHVAGHRGRLRGAGQQGLRVRDPRPGRVGVRVHRRFDRPR